MLLCDTSRCQQLAAVLALLMALGAFPNAAGLGTATTINGQGEVEYQFMVPGNSAFFRLESH
jgi:hypothetical protein